MTIKEVQLDLWEDPPPAQEKPRLIYECFICGECHLGECNLETIQELLKREPA